MHGRRHSIAAGLGALLLTLTSAHARVVPVHLSWTEDPQTTVTVCWERDTPGRGTVWCGLTTNYDISASDPGGYRRHHITLRDLLPGQLYHYKVSSTDGLDTPDHTFWTAPAITDSLHFVAHGDLQGGLNTNWARTVAEQVAAEGPQLVITPGDLSDEYGTTGFATWAQFFAAVSDEVERAVFMPAPGNHDNTKDPGALYWRLFDLPPKPRGERYYSFDAGNVHFVSLNTLYSLQSQTNWLARDLQAAAYRTNVTWIVVYFHHPPYSGGSCHGSDLDVREHFSPVFVRYEADVIFSGHNHGYERTIPIRGVTYVVTGGGGGWPYSVNPESFHEYYTTCYHHVSAQVTGAVMRYRGVRSDGLVFENLVFTNAGRFVRVEPVFPLRGDTVTITYAAARGPLFYSDPVYIHLGLDEFADAVVDAAMTSNPASGLWEYQYEVPATTLSRAAWAFHDAAATNWDNNYDHNWQVLLDRVEILPAVPTAGTYAAIRYEEEMGPLAGRSPIWAHVGFNGWEYLLAPNPLMTNNAAEGVLECQVLLPDYADELNVVFYSGTKWDRNEGIEWRVPVVGATAAAPPKALAILVPGSPVITTNPPQQNNIGDNFDFDMSGSAVRAQDVACGFGDFGEICFNYDETNLYVGGVGADLGGSNNVFVLFLGLDTLTDDAENLRHKSGLPNTLDYMHNVRFTEPMDIAIVFGSEWGDGPSYTNFTYAGYNFGQGIYYIGTNVSTFVPLANAGLSQFDGTGTTACATNDVDGNERTDRWEVRLPWADLNAPAGIDSVDCILLAGVIASDSTNGQDRYLSSTWVGRSISGLTDSYGNYGHGTAVIEPLPVLLETGDYDNDGLPNIWEHVHFATAAGPGPGEDEDEDRLSNWGEYVADTQPTNAQSVFAATSESGTEDDFVLSWPGAASRTYWVYRSTNAFATFDPIATNLPAALPENAYTDTVAGVENAAYKVEVRYEP